MDFKELLISSQPQIQMTEIENFPQEKSHLNVWDIITSPSFSLSNFRDVLYKKLEERGPIPIEAELLIEQVSSTLQKIFRCQTRWRELNAYYQKCPREQRRTVDLEIQRVETHQMKLQRLFMEQLHHIHKYTYRPSRAKDAVIVGLS